MEESSLKQIVYFIILLSHVNPLGSLLEFRCAVEHEMVENHFWVSLKRANPKKGKGAPCRRGKEKDLGPL